MYTLYTNTSGDMSFDSIIENKISMAFWERALAFPFSSLTGFGERSSPALRSITHAGGVRRSSPTSSTSFLFKGHPDIEMLAFALTGFGERSSPALHSNTRADRVRRSSPTSSTSFLFKGRPDIEMLACAPAELRRAKLSCASLNHTCGRRPP